MIIVNCEPTLRSESRGQTCLHYAEPRGGKDPEGGLTDERSNGERLLADYPLQGGGKDPEGGLIVNYAVYGVRFALQIVKKSDFVD